eukprot:SAG11_NODE_18701_length_483_cov_1.713542_1_plen_85_part_00
MDEALALSAYRASSATWQKPNKWILRLTTENAWALQGFIHYQEHLDEYVPDNETQAIYKKILTLLYTLNYLNYSGIDLGCHRFV